MPTALAASGLNQFTLGIVMAITSNAIHRLLPCWLPRERCFQSNPKRQTNPTAYIAYCLAGCHMNAGPNRNPCAQWRTKYHRTSAHHIGCSYYMLNIIWMCKPCLGYCPTRLSLLTLQMLAYTSPVLPCWLPCAPTTPYIVCLASRHTPIESQWPIKFHCTSAHHNWIFLACANLIWLRC